MNIKQQAHTKMFVAVLGVLDNFKTVWQAVVAFASARAALAAAIADNSARATASLKIKSRKRDSLQKWRLFFVED